MIYLRSTMLGCCILPDIPGRITSRCGRISFEVKSPGEIPFHFRINGPISFEVYHATDESIGRIDALLLTDRPVDANAFTLERYLTRLSEIIEAVSESTDPNSITDVIKKGDINAR